ncbi:MAG: polymer-forming cytoskeletal protein [Acidobacteria bacterium]|nr:polymer-forming cytoskeletal protein [Acidobacteriota bacterium]
MWNRRKEEEPVRPTTSYTPPPAPPAAEPVRERASMSPNPSRFDDASRGAATIGKNVTITGQIQSREDLIIDGEVDGTIELNEHRLTIGPNGKVKAGIRAREIVVKGNLNGNVEATDRIEICQEARLIGDIRTARIIIADGAYFKGNIDIIKVDAPVRKEAAPQPKPQPAAAAAPVQQTIGAAAGGEFKR